MKASVVATQQPVTPHIAVIGFPVGIDDRNRDRRALLRELWYPEYDNIGKTVRVEFVIGLLTYQGDGHEDRIVNELYDGARRRTLERPHHSMLICSHPRPPFAQIRRAYRARRPGARQRARSHARPIPRRPEVHRRKDCGVVPAGGGDAPQDAVSCGRSRAGHRACEAASECVIGAAQLLHQSRLGHVDPHDAAGGQPADALEPQRAALLRQHAVVLVRSRRLPAVRLRLRTAAGARSSAQFLPRLGAIR